VADLNIHDLSDRELLLLLAQEQRGTNERLDKQNGCLGEHDKRLRGLEDWRSKILGALGILSLIVVPLAIAFVAKQF